MFKKRILSLSAIICVMLALICVACIFFVGCGADKPDSTNSGLQFSNNEPDYSYKFSLVHYRASSGGYINGDIDQRVEYGQDGSAVTAVAYDGYRFVEWSDGVTTAERKATAMCDSVNLTVTALFEKIEIEIEIDIDISYEVRYLMSYGGCIIGNTKQVVKSGQNGSAVTAVAFDGYQFVEWSDGVKEATRTDSNIQDNISVKALFQTKICKIKYYYDTSRPGGIIQGEQLQEVEHGGSGSTVKAVPSDGYEFAGWSDGNTNPERTDRNVREDLLIQAYFREEPYQVKYKADKGGSIRYIEYVNAVYRGEQSSTVCAVPYSDYVFICWSDGLETPERTEYNVTCDMEFTAYFGYSVNYSVEGHGSIKGDNYQTALQGGDFSPVEAVPDVGYAFGGWSDLQTNSVRQDTNAQRNVEHIAYFEPIIKTFDYDYGIASGMPMDRSVTINRENIVLDGYPTPSIIGYTFEGWYADSEYKLKVINGDGRYMLGYYGFSLETDTLYARWKPIDETDPVFKILLVFVNEVEAMLYPTGTGYGTGKKYVHHIMTTIDRELCIMARNHMYNYLSECLSELTTIEVDACYLIKPIDETYSWYVPEISHDICFATWKFPELQPYINSYHSILSVFGLNNYDGYLTPRSTGFARTYSKYCWINLESMYLLYREQSRLQDYLNLLRVENNYADSLIGAFIHEFIHTCEAAFSDGEIYGFHSAIHHYVRTENWAQGLFMYREYLIGEHWHNDELVGIPKSFWTDTEKLHSLLLS